MPSAGNLTLQLADVRGNQISDTARIELSAASASRHYANREPIQGELTLTGIACEPQGLYRVTVSPTCYRSRHAFIALREGRTVTQKLVFPVNPGKVRCIHVPPYDELPAPLRSVVGSSDYGALGPLQAACLLNLAAKTSATLLGDGRSCLDHFGGPIQHPAGSNSGQDPRRPGGRSLPIAPLPSSLGPAPRPAARIPAQPQLQDQG